MSWVTSSSSCRTPHRIAVLIDDGRANAFDEIMLGNARQRDAEVLPEAFLHFRERYRRADVSQCDLERCRRHPFQSCERRARIVRAACAQPGDNLLDIFRAIAIVDPWPRRRQFAGGGQGGHFLQRRAHILRRTAIGQSRRKIGKTGCRNINIGQPAINRVGRADAAAGQRQMRARMAGRARQQE